ncbi:MAG TPA: hypothetical protein VFP80_03830 [Thermoanaerobaculia bacterium]|nr:hypothetical protein [Thermoanaerobaculia bacterium]
MRKVIAFAFAFVLLVAISTNVFAKMSCADGAAVYSPVTGKLADCLEGGGNDCLSCTVYPP